MEKNQHKKLFLLWIGGVVPTNRPFFEELNNHINLTVVSPRKWTHGSYLSKLKSIPKDLDMLITPFLPSGSSHYFIPMLPIHLLKHKPDYIYIMDELDRVNTLMHIIIIKIFSPRSTIITYSLQNIKAPAYYKLHHKIALKLNGNLIHKTISASKEAQNVLMAHGINKPSAIIPLGVSLMNFYPGNKKKLREKYTIDHSSLVLMYAGSITPEKGIFNVAQQLQSNTNINLIIVGNGPFAEKIMALKNPNIRVHPAVNSIKLLEYYQLSDYIILPSINSPNWNEQIGRTLLEGILCGCTAVGSRNGFIPSITLFKETQFDPESPKSIRSLLNSLPLARNNEIYRQQCENVKENFLWSTLAKTTYQFIGYLLWAF